MRDSAGDPAVHGALIPCVCVSVCLCVWYQTPFSSRHESGPSLFLLTGKLPVVGQLPRVSFSALPGQSSDRPNLPSHNKAFDFSVSFRQSPESTLWSMQKTREAKNQSFSQLRDVIHRNLAYLEGHESPLNTAVGTQRGWSELRGGDFSSTPPSPLPASKPILFNRCWTSHLKKKLGFQSPPPSIKRIQTEITTVFFVSMCLCLPVANRTICPLFRHEQEKRWERATERKKEIGEIDDSFWFLDGKRYSLFPFRFCSPYIAHARAKRRSNELKIQSRFRWEFGRMLRALRDAASVLAFPWIKIFEEGPSLFAAKRRKCKHVRRRKANKFRGLSWRSSTSRFLLVVSSCFRRLYGGPACIYGRSQATVAFSLNGCSAESKRIPSRSSCRLLQFVQTPKHETVNYHNKRSPTVPYPQCSLRYALRGWKKKFHTHAAQCSVAWSPLALRSLRAQWAPSINPDFIDFVRLGFLGFRRFDEIVRTTLRDFFLLPL